MGAAQSLCPSGRRFTKAALAGVPHPLSLHAEERGVRGDMTPATAEEDRSPPRSENRGFRRNYFSFFGSPLTPNSSKFEISPKFCEAFFNPVKFRQIFIKICSKTREIDSKIAKMMKFHEKCKKRLTKNCVTIWFCHGAKERDLVDLEQIGKMSLFSLSLVPIPPRTSPRKFSPK